MIPVYMPILFLIRVYNKISILPCHQKMIYFILFTSALVRATLSISYKCANIDICCVQFQQKRKVWWLVENSKDVNMEMNQENPAEDLGVMDYDTANINISGSAWTSAIADNKSLKDIAIPGTHNSATWKMITGETKCQNRNIGDQLNDGIRYFDIRVGYNGQLYHGDFACSVTLEDIISACVRHIGEHPKETVLVMLSWEGVQSYGLGAFQSWCAPVFHTWQQYWHFSEYIPKMEAVRGKIVLINGTDTGKKGLSLNQFKRQNNWDVGDWTQTWRKRAQMKVDLINNFINQSYNDGSDQMLMNNWNKQFNVGVSVNTYADYINGKMQDNRYNYPRGIQVMDFYYGSNLSRIISSNF